MGLLLRKFVNHDNTDTFKRSTNDFVICAHNLFYAKYYKNVKTQIYKNRR